MQELKEKEMKKRRTKDKSKEQKEITSLTSVHHIAAEAAIRKIKRVILRKRIEKYNIEN